MTDILVLNYEYPPLGGGASPVTAELAKTLSGWGHSIDVVTMRYDGQPRIEKDRDVTIYRTPSLRGSKSVCKTHEMLSFLPTGLWQAEKLIQENNYDVIHTHFIVPTGIISSILSQRHNIPALVTVHGSDVPNYNPDRFELAHKLIRPVWRKIVKTHDVIVSPSEYLASKVEQEVTPKEIDVIPNGFDPNKFDTNTEKEPRLLVSSRHFKRKGIQHLLKALSHIEISWDVVITGEGPYTEDLEELADEFDLKIDFVGWIKKERLNRLLETSEIFVFPSSHENCPVALQEAMAAGCAIITSEYGGSAELVGDAGITIDPTNTKLFATKIRSLIQEGDGRKHLQRKAKQRIQSNYSWEYIASQYIDVIDNIKEV